MRSTLFLFALATALSLSLLARPATAVVHGDTAAFCIANADKKVVCTNYCGVGKTCTATCKGASRKVTINAKTGRATWADKKEAGTCHHCIIIQDEHECSNYPESPKHAQMCPKKTKWFRNTMCINQRSGKSVKPGTRGVF